MTRKALMNIFLVSTFSFYHIITATLLAVNFQPVIVKPGMEGVFCVEISFGFGYDCGKEIFMEELMLQHKL